ncbi:MAG: hypothetical protein HOA85_02315 [Candidatus Pacebacteria bacterium]|jgi:hypothetical protein|nr:hypothetical protein [Candidatus Paceibacterota bacterium]
MHYSGMYKNKPAILKIQGTKPATSEEKMVVAFTNQNTSLKIRAPYLYSNLPWNEKLRFEAFIMEDVAHEKIINLPTNNIEITNFFDLYKEYRTNCLNKPWLEKPEIPLSKQTIKNFSKWKKISKELHPNHPLKQKEDADLLEKGVTFLSEKLSTTDWEFQHGHFSARDLHKVGGEIVILSNLYWSWRMPFYDAVFAFHWYQYDLANSVNISLDTLLEQRKLWKKHIENTIPKNEENRKLLQLAFLERALAGLNLDGLLEPSEKSKALMELTRTEIKESLSS